MSTSIYLDHHATSPILGEVREGVRPFLQETFGNPGSIHAFGRDAARALAKARGQVQGLLGAKRNSEVIFTGSGTEANNLAIVGAALSKGRGHIIAAGGEHDSVLDPIKALKGQGFDITLLPLCEEGLVRIEDLEAAIRPETILCSLGLANFEVGTLGPVSALPELLGPRGILWHCDASWAPGWIDLDVAAMKVDLLTISAHHFGGLKGVGALYCRRGVSLSPLIRGGYQERGRRPGTENVLGIVGMGIAAGIAKGRSPAERERVAALRDRLLEGIQALDEGCKINGAGAEGVPGLPGCLNISFPGLEGESILLSLDMEGVAASSGAACTSGTLEPSHVLEAMALGGDRAQSSLRFTLGFETTGTEIEHAIARIGAVIKRQRALG